MVFRSGSLRGFCCELVGLFNLFLAIPLLIHPFTALWRQTYFRPNKPLPNDVKSNQFHMPGTTPRRSFPRAILDFCIGFICLGIPYLFLERARSFGAGGRIMDDESTGGGLLRAGGAGAGPVFVVGACACLVVSRCLWLLYR
jgi:hypothetical protein